MIKSFVCIVFLSLFSGMILEAQVVIPQSSPFVKLQQTVGLTTFTVEYSSPARRGRSVFGDLVPYEKYWRTGANGSTKIAFNTDVNIGGKRLKKGTYSIYTKPSARSWEVFFYKDLTDIGTPKTLDLSKVMVSIVVPISASTIMEENFHIRIVAINYNLVKLTFSWENTVIAVPISLYTSEAVEETITRTLSGNSEPNYNDYYSAAKYYFEDGKDINKAKEWIDKAVQKEQNPKYFTLRQQALIYAKLRKKAEAVKMLQASLYLAEKEDAVDFINMNNSNLREWAKKDW